MTAREADFNDPAFPLELTVNLIGTGGVAGLACTVAIRLAGSAGFYLDWATNTFKNAGWVTQFEPMTDIGNGDYEAILPVALLGFTQLTPLPVVLVAEYHSPGAPTTGGLDHDEVTVSELRPDAKLARQYNTNKLTALAPGQLTLFEDDGVTVQSVQVLLDAFGNPIVNKANVPAIRGHV